jgi:siroheme synthase-like protein
MNQLFPIFYKPSQITIILIGGGTEAVNKLKSIINSTPSINLTILSNNISVDMLRQIQDFGLQYKNKTFEESDLATMTHVVSTTKNKDFEEGVYKYTLKNNQAFYSVNFPELSNFFIEKIITKGDIKLSISNNGKQNEIIPQVKDYFNEMKTSDVNEISQNINEIAKTFGAGVIDNIKTLNNIATDYLKDKSNNKK